MKGIVVLAQKKGGMKIIVYPFIWTTKLALLCESCNTLLVIFVIIKYLAPPKSLTLGNVSKLPLLSLNRDFLSCHLFLFSFFVQR